LGGSIIKVDIVAACGLSLEFGNRVVTSTIQKIFVVVNGSANKKPARQFWARAFNSCLEA
jgi:hypothetical protein